MPGKDRPRPDCPTCDGSGIFLKHEVPCLAPFHDLAILELFDGEVVGDDEEGHPCHDHHGF